MQILLALSHLYAYLSSLMQLESVAHELQEARVSAAEELERVRLVEAEAKISEVDELKASHDGAVE